MATVGARGWLGVWWGVLGMGVTAPHSGLSPPTHQPTGNPAKLAAASLFLMVFPWDRAFGWDLNLIFFLLLCFFFFF